MGREVQSQVEKAKSRSRRSLRNLKAVAEIVLGQGGHVSFEWPKGATGWALPELTSLIKRHNLYEAITDGCAHGLCDKNGVAHFGTLAHSHIVVEASPKPEC